MAATVRAMYSEVAVEGEMVMDGSDRLQVCAKAYVPSVMHTAYPTMCMRNARDRKLTVTLLDHLLSDRFLQIGDILSQQLKSLEQL